MAILTHLQYYPEANLHLVGNLNIAITSKQLVCPSGRTVFAGLNPDDCYMSINTTDRVVLHDSGHTLEFKRYRVKRGRRNCQSTYRIYFDGRYIESIKVFA